jgi:hypothetical protein
MGLVCWPTVLAYRCIVSPALNALLDAVVTGGTGAGERAGIEQRRIAMVAVDVVDYGGGDDFSLILATLAEGVCC